MKPYIYISVAMKNGKFDTNDGEANNLCMMTLLVELFLFARNSAPSLRAIATLDGPGIRLSLQTVCTAHSRWRAAVSADEMTVTKSSMFIA